jgi:DNA-binding response OmpR family regulator
VKKVILLVEDEIVIAVGVSMFLEGEGFEVHLASDGRKGLEVALEKSPDLIITDYMMPRMDGLTMVQALREAGVTTPVILFTSIPEDRLRGNPNTSYDAYLSKPVPFEDLIALVRALLEA